jgi:hypothetical protein
MLDEYQTCHHALGVMRSCELQTGGNKPMVFAFDPRLIRLILELHKTLILTLEPEKVPKDAFWRIC